jgi:membrane protease YdiL (CAAX protease family)
MRRSHDLTLAALALGYGAISQRYLPRRRQVAANTAAAVAAIAVARASALSWDELGLDASQSRQGWRLGLATVPPVCAIYLVLLGLPSARHLLADDRVRGMEGRDVAFDALIRIPLATVVAEELVFRSALLGLAVRARGRGQGLVLSAAVFGLWHVLPAVHSHDASPARAELAGRAGGRAATVATTVAATAAAGVALGWLRLRARSVVAPMVTHAAVNIGGLLAARWAVRRSRSARS